MSISHKIFLRKDYKNTDGTNTVCLQILANRKKRQYSLPIPIKINPKYWIERTKRISTKHPDDRRLNKLLTKYENSVQNIVDDFILNDKTFSFSAFEDKFYSYKGTNESFYEFAETEIKKRKMADETRKGYLSQLTKLQEFRKHLTVDEIDTPFLEKYRDYMKDIRGNKASTADKSLRILRVFIGWALDAEIIKDNPFKKVKIKHHEGNRVALEIEELERLERLYNSDSLETKYKIVLRYFLFCCFTGLRYSDIKRLKHKHLTTDVSKGIEFPIIKIDMHKTKQFVEIPIVNRAYKLIDTKHVLKSQPVFKVYTSQPTNRHLKDIMKLAGINKEVSFHCSRHTFATIAYELKIDEIVVQKVLGHQDRRTTAIYRKVRNNKKYEELKKMDK